MKRYKLGFFIMLFLIKMSGMAQSKEAPVKIWNNNNNSPVVLYLSGDGGFNNFSNNYCELLGNQGYTVAAVDSKSFFWDKKSPDQITKELSNSLSKLLVRRTNQLVYFVGYSFGADVIPFVVNRLSVSWKQRLKAVALLEPSSSTDLEIHVADLWGRSNIKRGMDVVAEINRMVGTKTSILLGEDETNFPVKQIHLNDIRTIYLKGDHHFDGNALEVVKATIKSF
ncbi:virulence protein [Sphingobacterium sp. SRCM116780]|uniref:AcvB/VirJ family lysyl-phosphatidylglycerol hydrolase n=1 Tax=Sphingobacterium sp. SRCM116780 TaxID=2907623 RepID=UPI001F21C6B9|nr:AcvB/VirJ family lysyl-phosphatidylglycerol hydrolase [Sphingobacterium sp. SRCM116780]UIR55614.1 virulence protein [Sphingobacterium sp. SRCM116780]